MKQVIRLALGGIAVGVLVLALKYTAYRVTGILTATIKSNICRR